MIGRSLVAVLALTFVTAYAAEAQVVTDGLIAYWTFDEADIDDDVAIDVIGGHDGTIFGEPEIIEGQLNEALEFDGVSDYIEADIPAGLLLDGITFELWFQQEAPIGWGIMVKINPGEIELSIDGGAPEIWNDNLGGVAAQISFSDGNWHHAAIPISKDNMVLYLDGEKIGENASNLNFADQQKMTIARDPTFDFWPGMIDEVRIYDRPLSEEEVQQNMEAKGISVEPADKLAETWGKIKVSG